MNNPLLETAPIEEAKEDEEQKERENCTTNGYGSQFVPKETELRLGLFVNSFDKEMCMVKHRNEGFGAKRWFSEAKDGFDSSWSTRLKQEKNAIFPPNHQQMDLSPLLPPRAPAVVGWPPVRSFRRNLAFPPKPAAEMESKGIVEDPKNKSEESMYVKVNMEGYPIGRKINIMAHGSYESLSKALQEMFDNFFSVNCSKNQDQVDEEQGVVSPEHVLIYEDNEGDRMLVGDVPWEMFVSTVKRLHIICGSKAPSTVTETKGRKQ